MNTKNEQRGPSKGRITPGYARYVFGVLFCVSVFNYLDRYVFVGAANVMGRELGFQLDGIGLMTTIFQLVYTLATVPLSIWADRAPRKRVVVVCLAAWSLLTVLIAGSLSFPVLFGLFLLLGISEAGYFPASQALMSDYFSRARRSRVMSWWSIAQLFGMLGGLVLGGAVAGFSWRLAFLVAGLPGLLLVWFAWRIREPRHNQAEEEAREAAGSPLVTARSEDEEEPGEARVIPRNVVAQFRSLLRIKTLRALIVMQIFGFFVLGVSTSFLPTYLQQSDTFGFSSARAGLYSGGIIVLAGMAGMVSGGYIADRLSRRFAGGRVLVCGLGFLLSAPAFALSVTTHNLVGFTGAFVLTVFLLAMYTGPSMAATQDVVPSALRASAVAITLLIAHMLGDVFSPSLVGWLATVFDPTRGQHFRAGAAGQDLGLALLVTCGPALVIAGLVGIFGARWMKNDIAAAEEGDGGLILAALTTEQAVGDLDRLSERDLSIKER